MIITNLEKFLCILTTNIVVGLHAANCILDSLCIPISPATGVLNGLKRIIDTEENPVCANLIDDILKGSSGEVTTSSKADVLLEVIIDGLLAYGSNTFVLGQRLLDIFQPVTDAPEVERNVLTQVSSDDF